VDTFWTIEETIFRRKARDYFCRQDDPFRTPASAKPARIWRDLGGARDAAGGKASPAGVILSERVLIIEEAALYSPRLGRALLRWRASEALGDPVEDRLCRLASIAGTAAYVFEAGTRTARYNGLFASSLMGFREIQESLAGLACGVELLRLGTCRVCRLLDQGRRDLGETESALLHAKALTLLRDARSVAVGLLGAAWLKKNIPRDESSSPNERNVS
jgi:hypothetical protein